MSIKCLQSTHKTNFHRTKSGTEVIWERKWAYPSEKPRRSDSRNYSSTPLASREFNCDCYCETTKHFHKSSFGKWKNYTPARQNIRFTGIALYAILCTLKYFKNKINRKKKGLNVSWNNICFHCWTLPVPWLVNPRSKSILRMNNRSGSVWNWNWTNNRPPFMSWTTKRDIVRTCRKCKTDHFLVLLRPINLCYPVPLLR